MRTRFKTTATAASVLAIGAIIAACGTSSSPGSNPSPSTGTGTTTGFSKIAQNATGTPVKGGILNVIGSGDVDYMDPNLNYYTVGYTAAREYSRQLYTYPAVQGQTTTVVPDLATGAPVLSDGGKTETITIKQGADWNTSPKRQVSAADEVRGVEITCNPAEPFGGTPDFSSLIVGYKTFCAGFEKVSPTAAAIKAYLGSHTISGVSVGSTPETVVFKLTQPATYFESELALPALSPRAAETLAYIPGSAADQQHTISDGPYEIKTYVPTKSIDFVRNPAWDPSTDSVRKAYVNEIKVTEGEQQTSIDQQLEQNVPSADLSWDLGPIPTEANKLIQQNYADINVQSEIAANPYLVFNTQSPNNGGALGKAVVRQALSYAINRADLLQDAGGPKLAPALTHILPPTIDGSVNASYYPYSESKAKSLLASAGIKNLTIKFLYRPASSTSVLMYQDIQSQLSKIGVKVTPVTASPQDFYVKYLEKPSSARSGAWDVSLAGWGPDWYGNAALSFFEPLFDGKILPPLSSDFGLYNDNTVDTLITKASKAATVAASTALWTQADQLVMKDAAIYPIDDPNAALLHGSQVHNDVYLPALDDFDYTNVWLETSKNGD